jgi:hypothetical protein
MKAYIHVEVFIASRKLQQRQATFSTSELANEVRALFGDTRPGVSTHISAHCVGNAPKNEGTASNYLWRVDQGHLRCFNPITDKPHPDRINCRTHPDAKDMPVEFCGLIDR